MLGSKKKEEAFPVNEALLNVIIDTFFANKLYARIRSDILFIIEMEYEKHDIEINLQTNTVLFTIAEGIYKHQYNITPNILEEIIADKIILLNCLYGEQ